MKSAKVKFNGRGWYRCKGDCKLEFFVAYRGGA